MNEFTTQYLSRINIKSQPKLDLQNLSQLQRQHLLNIPFENLDIHMDTPIRLDINRIFTKVITNKRGGFCYELNGLFHQLLVVLGFEAKLITCRVYKKEIGFGKEHAHMAILVKLDNEEYLCDVGFGAFTMEPLVVKLGRTQKDLKGDFQIDIHTEQYLKVSKWTEGILTPEYIFKTTAMNYLDFEEMCHYTQTNPESHFTQKIIITRPTLNGRISLSGKALKITVDNKVKEQQLKNKSDFDNLLWEYFNICLKNFPFNPQKDSNIPE